MKNFNQLKDDLTKQINMAIEGLDLQIYELNNNNDFDTDTLQVLVECKSNPMKSLDLDTITSANEEISTLLDLYDSKINEPYSLEVASAGIERPITSAEALKKAVGEYIHVDLKAPDKNISSFEGTLDKYDEDKDTFNFSFFIKGQPKKKQIKFDDIKFVRYAIKF